MHNILHVTAREAGDCNWKQPTLLPIIAEWPLCNDRRPDGSSQSSLRGIGSTFQAVMSVTDELSSSGRPFRLRRIPIREEMERLFVNSRLNPTGFAAHGLRPQVV
jgi:hypothetical protein